MERARLALTGKQLTHELKTLLSEIPVPARVHWENRRYSQDRPSGVRMNDMSKDLLAV